MSKSVIIIGAGLSGLSAGCYAQMNGYESRIFEHQSSPGGVVASWKRKGYVIDGGVHFWTNPQAMQREEGPVFELGIAQAHRFTEMETYASFVDAATGREITLTQDLERFVIEMQAAVPDEEGLLDTLINGARLFDGIDAYSQFEKPQELMGIVDGLKQMWALRGLRKVMGYSESMADFFGQMDPWCRFVMENTFLPEAPVWFVMMLLGMLEKGQLAMLDGISQDVPRSLAERYEKLGGAVTYRATVKDILVDDGRACGVRLEDGSERKADAVISAADGRSTIFGMLDAAYVDEVIAGRYEYWPVARPLVMVSLGVNRRFDDEPWLKICRPARPILAAGSPTDCLAVRTFNYSDRFSEPGKTVLQVSFDTDWDKWDELRQEPDAYKDEKERVAESVLSNLDSLYSGVSGSVELIDVATPWTMWRRTLNFKGAYMGWAPCQETLGSRMEKKLPYLADFYMAGQWAMPGGGVMPALYSGRQAVQLLCYDDGRSFSGLPEED